MIALCWLYPLVLPKSLDEKRKPPSYSIFPLQKNAALHDSLQALTIPKPRGLILTVFRLQLLCTPRHLSILLQSVSNNKILWQRKLLVCINWCIKQNKKMTDTEFLLRSHNYYVYGFTCYFYVFCLSLIISRYLLCRTVWITPRSHPLPNFHLENTNLD